MIREIIKRYLDKHNKESIEGKTILFVGATSGIGLAALEELLYLKAKVIISARDVKAAEEKIKPLGEKYNTSVEVFELDLASLDSIKKFVAKVKRRNLDLDGVILNAGCFGINDKLTVDGYPYVMGVNYIGNYYLVERLLPYLQGLTHDVKLVITTSNSYKRGKADSNVFFLDSKKRGNYTIYATSKLYLLRYSFYLANMLMDSNIRVLFTHPGLVHTKILDGIYKAWYLRCFSFIKYFCKKPDKGALGIPYALTNSFKDGTLLGPKAFSFGYPKKNKIKKKGYSNIEKLLKNTKSFIRKKEEKAEN